MKTIEVDPRVPGIRDEIPFPQAKQCSPELDSPVVSSVLRSVRNYSVCRKNLSSQRRWPDFVTLQPVKGQDLGEKGQKRNAFQTRAKIYLRKRNILGLGAL